tara:strand:+ start:2256 stop:2618 length:363 start_codon:yes stop_codon:yes gene_type:complete
MNKANFGGGNIFKNQRKIERLTINIEHASNHNERQPDISGDIEVTKDMARHLVEAFKNKETTTSKRKQTEGQQVTKLEIAGKIWEGRSGQYFSVWLQEPYKKPNPEPVIDNDEIEDEIPF